MKRLICLLVALGIVVSTVGCVNPIGLESVLEENKVVSFFEDVKRVVPPPYFVRSFLETTTIGTGEDRDIFDFEDCDWDVQKYYSVGTYSVRSDKGWVINLTPTKVPSSYLSSTPAYLYVGHGNHKLYDNSYGTIGYFTPSSLRIQSYSGTMSAVSSYLSDATSTGSARISSPLFVMKENYVTSYLLYNDWISNTLYYTSLGGTPYCNVVVSLIDATSGNTASSKSYDISSLRNIQYMWMPVILNGSAYKGRTMFLRIDVSYNSGACMKSSPVYGTFYMTGYTYDIYFDEIHFSDEYGDYISYYTSIPPVPNYSYTISDRTVAVNGTSSTDNGTITEYRWSWGDGTQSFDAIQTHLYSADGNYTVQLCVTDDEQMTVCIQKVLNVKTTPETNEIVTGDTDDEEPTDPIVAPPVDNGDYNDGNNGDGVTVAPPATNPFPVWDFLVTVFFALIALSAILVLTNKKNRKALKRIGKPKGGKKK